MNREKQTIKLRSEELNDILGRVPRWITRNGILVLSLFILVLLLGAWIIKIPDIKQATIVLSSSRPAASVTAKETGRIDQLLVEDNQVVKQGEILAMIENAADLDRVLELERALENLHIPDRIPTNLDLPSNGAVQLGPIQADYAGFYKAYQDLLDFKELNYHSRKIELLNQELLKLDAYSDRLKSRASLSSQDLELALKQYQRDSVLLTQEVVSESVFEQSRSEMLARSASLEEILTLMAQNDIDRSRVQSQILELELKSEEDRSALITTLEAALNRLRSAIADWEKRFLIVAPMDGLVTFTSYWSENQNVKPGEVVLTIVPVEDEAIVGKIQLPVRGAGEVMEGNPVNIKFANYPYLEYGMVKGQVTNISRVPIEGIYTVEVMLPEGLKTYYGMEIAFNEGMEGEAEIVTDKMRLLQRIFNPLKSSISRQREL